MSDPSKRRPVGGSDPSAAPAGMRRGDAGTGRAVELADGFFQVAGSGLSHPWDAAAYLVTGPQPFLIDAGSPRAFPRLLRNVDAAGVDPASIGAVIGTHGHYDHVGAAARFGELGVPLWLHPDDHDAVATADPIRTTAGLLYRSTFPAVTPAAALLDGDSFDTGTHRVEVLHTPGHTPGSVCLLVHHAGDDPVLVAGDTLWGGWHPEVSCDLATWARSLERLTTVDFDGYTFGHGEARLSRGGPARISEALHRFGYYLDPWFVPPADVAHA